MKKLLLALFVFAMFANSLVQACGCGARPRPTTPGVRAMVK